MATRPTRRRAPLWVRQSSSETLHALAHRFARARADEGLTERQELLWDCLVSELEYRHRSRAYPLCGCWLFLPEPGRSAALEHELEM